MTNKELEAWERKQAANRRAYERERRERIGRRWENAGLLVGSAWVLLQAIIIAAFIYAFWPTAAWWWVALFTFAIPANIIRHWIMKPGRSRRDPN